VKTNRKSPGHLKRAAGNIQFGEIFYGTVILAGKDHRDGLQVLEFARTIAL
jgi:hypothetical protein